MKRILILASNSRGDLRIDREIRDLEKAIERSKNSEKFDIKIKLAVCPEDLQELFYDNQPHIVHFCGHGAGEKGLLFESEEGREQLVSNQALGGLCRIFQENIECVLLNACHTEIQVDVVVEHIPYAIGTSKEILDKAAYWFSVGFYKALAREQSIRACYDWGFNTVQLKMPNVNIVAESTEKYRKLIAIGEDGSNIASEPLKIVLKQKSTPDESSQPSPPETPKPKAKIPVDFREEIAQEIEIQEYKNSTRQILDNLGNNTQNLVKAEPISKTEYRQRQTLLNKVKEFWIEGFLKPSLYADNAINLELKSRPDAILRPFTNSEVLPIELDDSFAELKQTDIYQQLGNGKTFLILGEPGSGKTITLLQLAEHLIAQTEQDLTKAIPIVFNLSSWGQKQQPLMEWLIEEFKDKYQVPQFWSEQWLKQEQLILLLDGLDEVRTDRREACVRTINQFIATHNLTEIVVCSRVKDYEALNEKLQLSTALCIKSLTSEQVYSFLDKVGDSLSGLRTLLQQDIELEQFAQTPLILNVMSLAYQDWSTADLLKELRSTNNPYEHLFDSYIERMLRRKSSSQSQQPYSRKKIIHWLSWLAKKMVEESKIIFLIEKLQPSLLNTQDKNKYQINSGLMVGLIGGIISGLHFGMVVGLIGGIDILLNLGIVGGLYVMIFGLILGLYLGMIFGFYGMIFGLIGGLIRRFKKTASEKITLYEQISWSWQRTRSNLLNELIFGLIFGLIYALINWLIYGGLSGLQFGLIYGLLYGLIVGLTKGIISNEIIHKALPNQGIWSSARNAIKFSLISGLISGLIVGLISILIYYGLNYGKEQRHILNYGLFYGPIGGFIGGLANGGFSCVQHFNLRRILHRQGYMPWNYASFLDYASERLLMKKVGGGYVFYHRMLMEHFANMELDK